MFVLAAWADIDQQPGKGAQTRPTSVISTGSHIANLGLAVIGEGCENRNGNIGLGKISRKKMLGQFSSKKKDRWTYIAILTCRWRD